MPAMDKGRMAGAAEKAGDARDAARDTLTSRRAGQTLPEAVPGIVPGMLSRGKDVRWRSQRKPKHGQ
jgi:hypothetical protein